LVYRVFHSQQAQESIPRGKDGKYDLFWLLKWKVIVICYDNDDAGRNGAIKLKNELMKVANNG